MVNKTIEIILTHTDDGEWVALYINGKKELEGHSLFSGTIIDLLSEYTGYKIIYSKDVYVNSEAFEEYCRGVFPIEFNDIPEEVLISVEG